jgi:segregation and condensation protein B
MKEEFLTKSKVKSIIESLFFINEKSVKIDELIQIIEIDKKDIEAAMDELIIEYDQRDCGLCIVKVAGGYQMCTAAENEPWIKKMYRERSKQKLSVAALETLAIIAYKQPVTRMEIEAIRGVNVDGVMRHLLNLGLIKTGGRKEVVGRPFLYITTRKFLEYFGLNTVKDLPRIEDFISLAEKSKSEDTATSEDTTNIDEEASPEGQNSNNSEEALIGTELTLEQSDTP